MVTIEKQHVSIIVLIAAIVLISIGLGTDKWSCGNLFDSCLSKIWGNEHYNASLAMIVLTLIGIGLFAVVLLIDLIGFIKSDIHSNRQIQLVRTILLFIGFGCAAIGIIVFTVKVMPFWSYLVTTAGIALGLVAAILGLMMYM